MSVPSFTVILDAALFTETSINSPLSELATGVNALDNAAIKLHGLSWENVSVSMDLTTPYSVTWNGSTTNYGYEEPATALSYVNRDNGYDSDTMGAYNSTSAGWEVLGERLASPVYASMTWDAVDLADDTGPIRTILVRANIEQKQAGTTDAENGQYAFQWRDSSNVWHTIARSARRLTHRTFTIAGPSTVHTQYEDVPMACLITEDDLGGDTISGVRVVVCIDGTGTLTITKWNMAVMLLHSGLN